MTRTGWTVCQMMLNGRVPQHSDCVTLAQVPLRAVQELCLPFLESEMIRTVPRGVDVIIVRDECQDIARTCSLLCFGYPLIVVRALRKKARFLMTFNSFVRAEP